MRLLELSESGELILTEFFGENIPPYAILSHTWDIDNRKEVTYRDVEHGSYRDKPGYEKIRFCARQATADGLQYSWVDTCCIDKSSSTELPEAINSMFSWYKQAEICYVSLDDYDKTIPSSSGSPDIFAIGRCRWFTRGWCLQELVAPRELTFYDCKWRQSYSKKDHAMEISIITGIDQSVLKDSSLINTIPVARRMFWASARKTSRSEDVAYSLFGIFDVQMPLLYGEGEKAFIRLQEEIIKKSNDLSIFAWTAHSSDDRYQDLFAPLPSYFTRRITQNTWSDKYHLANQSQFLITNRGLRFLSVNMSVGADHANPLDLSYVLSLRCSAFNGGHLCLLLKKIGPGLFVKISVQEDVGTPSQLELSRVIERDVYVVTNITPGLSHSIQASHSYSFEVQIASPRKRHYPIQSLEPLELWDATRSTFLTLRDGHFAGYLLIDPSFDVNEKLEFFVVALGFTGFTMDGPYVCLVEAYIWQQHNAQRKPLARTISDAVADQHEAVMGRVGGVTQLLFASYIVSAMLTTTWSGDQCIFRVVVDCLRRKSATRTASRHWTGEGTARPKQL